MDVRQAVDLTRRAAGMPVRILNNGMIVEYFGHELFEPDPAAGPSRILHGSGHRKCFWISPEYMFYGLVQSTDDQESLVFGPASPFVCTREQAASVLKANHQPFAAVGPFMRWLSGILPCELQRFTDILDLAEHLIWGAVGEKSVQVIPAAPVLTVKEVAKPRVAQIDFISAEQSNAMAERLLGFVTHGNVQLIEKTFAELGDAFKGVPLVSSDSIRNFKNLLIANAVYASSAAISGGLSRSAAIAVSDSYIRQVESLDNYIDIINLLQKMYLELAARVASLQVPETDSLLVHKLYRQIQDHLDEKLTPTTVSRYLKVSTSHLCRSIKASTGQTVSNIINTVKIAEARRLLAETALPIMQISLQLGFTSQNYFQTVFRKHTGLTPVKFRKKQL